MKTLFIDTETTGVPKDYKASYKDTDNWPRMVQLGWALYQDGKEIETWEELIVPDGWEISQGAAEKHGITTKQAERDGVSIWYALGQLAITIARCDLVVGHNVGFDLNVIGAEAVRMGLPYPFENVKTLCTMHATTEWCELPGKWGDYKWPKLGELWSKLFSEPISEQHTALADCRTTAKCYWALKEKGVI
jgi:DNA polymerase III epsilon subunit-like protein